MTKTNLYRREGSLVYIKQPEFNELDYIVKLWDDFSNLKDLKEPCEFPKDKWELFYRKMVFPSDGKNFYCLIYKQDGVPIGEVSFHGYDVVTKIARFNIKIETPYRRNGYGAEAARLLLEYFFYEVGGLMMMDTVSNDTGKAVLNKLGFEVIRKYGEEVSYKLTKEKFSGNDIQESRVVGIVINDGVDLISFSPVIDVLSATNRLFGREYFKFKTVALEKNDVVTSSNIRIKVDQSFEEFDKANILIIPSGRYFKEDDYYGKIIKFIKKSKEETELLVGIASGMFFIASCGLLDNSNVPNNKAIFDEIKLLSKNVHFVNNPIVDNGRVILCANNSTGIELAFYVAKKFFGEEKAREIARFIV